MFHFRSYGDVTKAQLDEYTRTGKITFTQTARPDQPDETAAQADAKRWRYCHDEPEAARHLLRLLLDGKGKPSDLDKMVDRIIASKSASKADAGKEPQ